MIRTLALVSLCGLLFLSVRALSKPPAEERAQDRAEIRAHIEGLFQAFIDHDSAKLRAGRSDDWRGFLEGSQEVVKGADQYIEGVAPWIKTPNTGMKLYKITSYDTVFDGENHAIVSFIADVESHGGASRTVRIMDIYAKRNGRWIQTGSHTTRISR
jgi:hypothetical protein